MASGPLLEIWLEAGPHGAGEDAAWRYLDQHAQEISLGSRPTARLQPNRFGLFDLHGNVAEWCADAWDGHSPYDGRAPLDPRPLSGNLGIARGGSWFSPPAHARSAARAGYAPDATLPFVGFRFVIPHVAANGGR
jgi:formylglycine-generating enzyme required for sulfatase activity